MGFNPAAIASWMLGGCIGYLIGESLYATVAGVTVPLTLSVYLDMRS